jgi:uncharacterized protein (TIGR02145 family)
MKTKLTKTTIAATLAIAISLTLSCNEAKCGGKIYNPESQFCLNNVAIDKCGGAEYEPAKQFCVADNIYPKCGEATYDPLAQFCDTRENKLYGIVTIGTQTWMAENMNAKGGKCYGDAPTNCDKYGMLYAWEEAKGICPQDWRLPDDVEWNTLINYIGGASKAGLKLKAKDNPNDPKANWELNKKAKKTGNGTDDYGFTAFPGGYGSDGKFLKVAESGAWWSAFKGASQHHHDKFVDINYDSEASKWSNVPKNPLFSVRCIREKALNVKCGGNEYNPSTQYCHTDGKTYSCGNLPYNPATEFCNSGDDKAYPICEENYEPSERFCDSRDKKTYRYAVVGLLTWMAENLNYKTGTSWCYGDDDFNCKKYGRLYVWETAKKACPSGWHLPTKAELSDLLDKSGMVDAMAGGIRKCEEGGNCSFTDGNNRGWWWTATASGDAAAKAYDFESEYDISQPSGLSVRCVKNEEKKK